MHQIGVKSYSKGNYGDIKALGAIKNKPKQTQFVGLRSEIRSSELVPVKTGILNPNGVKWNYVFQKAGLSCIIVKYQHMK
jgi:hypothetical protein